MNERCTEKVKMTHSTCKYVNRTFRVVRIAQDAGQPQDHNGVDGHNVTHVLVEVEVL